MGNIATFDQALTAIWERSGYDRGFISNPFAGDDAARRGLVRTQAMLDHLGNPERACKIIHVAGSKGKGSTCMFIDAILRASGLSCGRYLSPHLHSWRERFVVDNTLIPEADFTMLTAEAIAVAERVEQTTADLGRVTAFELSTVIALLWFQWAGCDVAVVEVGLGGTLDATNVVDPAVSVITQLDYEHTAILGTTLSEIAGNKAGIIKPGRPVVSAAQPEEGQRVIRQRADACSAPLLLAGRDWIVSGTDRSFIATGPWGTLDQVHISLAGHHQVENAGLAIAAVHMFRTTDVSMTGITRESMRAGLQRTRFPGRFEQIRLTSGQTVVIDGAHSPASTAALATTMRDRFPDEHVAIVIGMLRDKDPALVAAPLMDIADQWIAVTPQNPRALPAGTLKAAVESLGMECIAVATVAQGLRTAQEHGSSAILVTGSIATVAEARVALRLA